MGSFSRIFAQAILLSISTTNAKETVYDAQGEAEAYWSRFILQSSSFEPTSPPVQISLAPTLSPSESPSERLSLAPSAAPTSSPSATPTSGPSTGASPSPTVSGCTLAATIGCLAADGTECVDLLPPATCEVPGASEVVSLAYTYTVENSGNIETDITRFQRSRNGELVDFLGDVLQANPLQPFDSVSTTETLEVDLCIDSSIVTGIVAEAVPPEGSSCFAAAVYEFSIENNCILDVEIACIAEDGTSCDQLSEANSLCSQGELISSLTFQYEGTSCEASSDEQGDTSSCEDLNGGVTDEDVSVSCVGPDGTIFPPSIVGFGDTFTINQVSGLPSELTCTLSSVDGVLLQVVTFDPSGRTDLALRDRFGGLLLQSCSDLGGVDLVCTTDITWTFDAINIGGNDLTVSLVEIVRGDTAFDLTAQVENTQLAPGESAPATFMETIDLCVPGNFTTLARVEGSPPGEGICSAEAVFEFEFDVGCDVFLEVDCATVDSEIPCKELEGEQDVQCICDDCPNEVIFRYTGLNAPSTMEIAIVSEDGEVVFDGIVTIDDDIFVTSDECLAMTHVVTLTDPITGEEFVSAVVDTSCDGPGLTLLDSIGPLDFVGYTCRDDDIPHNCYVDVEYSYVVSNTGEVPMEITALGTTINGVTTDLIANTNPTDLIIDLGGSFETFTGIEVELCTSTMYSSISSVTASSPDPTRTCSDNALLSFATTTGTPFPTVSPSAVPSALPSFAPTLTPTNTPSDHPSTSPSEAPTLTPSFTPSSKPSTNPTLGPSTFPSASPSTSPSPAPSASPSTAPSPAPSASPSAAPSPAPSASPSPAPSASPSPAPSASPSAAPSPAPSSTPTNSPTPGQTASPPPTPDPETAACEIEASISCSLSNGETCDLRSPAGETCIGDNADLLQFIYTPTSFCNGNNTSTNFQCSDFNLGVPRPQSAYIRASQGANVLFMGVRSAGQIFDVPILAGNTFMIEVFTPVANGPGTLLQESQISTQCNEAAALSLLSTFGHMELVGFRNEEQGLQQIFANIQIVYTATNVGPLDLNLVGAFGSSPFSGFQDFLAGDVATLGADENEQFSEEFTLNLAASAGNQFQFTFLAQGDGSISQVGCDDTDAFTLSVL